MRVKHIRCATALSFLLVTSTPSVLAQTVFRADAIQTQPTINRDDTGFSACGVRVVATIMAGSKAVMHDFSVNVFRTGFTGVIKAGKYLIPLRTVNPAVDMKVVTPAPVGFWIARADQAVALKPVTVIPAIDSGFIMGPVPIVETLQAVIDIADGKEVQFALRYKDESIDRIVSFAKPLSTVDRSALQSCIEGLIKATETASK